MDTKRKWDLENGFSSETKGSDEKKHLHVANLLFKPHGVKQFYQFHLHEKTWTNGNLHRNEIKKLIHLTANQDKSGTNHIQIESFDRVHFNRNLTISEKEFLGQIASVLDDVKLGVNTYGKDFKIENLTEIQSKFKRTLEKLQKNYVGENAERQFRFLNTFYSKPDFILKDLFNYKLYGLLLPKFYGYYDIGQIREYRIHYTQLLENKVIPLSEKVEISNIDELKNRVQLYVSGSFADNLNTDACRLILSNRNISFSENDKAKLDKYEGSFEFQKETGLVLNSDLNIEFSFGENYRKNITYSLKSIHYEEA